MIKLDLIPTWAYGAVIALLVAAVAAQQIRVSGLRADVATAGSLVQTERAGRAQDNADRLAAALDHTKKINELQAAHAASQQTTEDGYAAKIKLLEGDKRAGAAIAGRLRDTIATYAASGGAPGETDAAAIERYADRLGVVSGLLVESVDLVTEGRDVIKQRDIEVGRLLDQIRIDRMACTAAQVGVPQNK